MMMFSVNCISSTSLLQKCWEQEVILSGTFLSPERPRIEFVSWLRSGIGLMLGEDNGFGLGTGSGLDPSVVQENIDPRVLIA